MIEPDPRCAEGAMIMLSRFAHGWILISNGTEIKLSDYGWDVAPFTCGTCGTL
jgi:hypothetical protein